MPGHLFVVATPIGNLQDVSMRAREVLTSVDGILCEDTRVTAKLIASFELQKPLISYHQHSTEQRTQDILASLRGGKNFALVTDAGTPGISDPGGKLVEAVVHAFGSEAIISPIPGPNAAVAALSISGFPTDAFLFLGFPPHKKGRQGYFTRVAECEDTVVFYESTHRILKTLDQLGALIGDRPVVVGRELTKMHEEVVQGTPEEVRDHYKNNPTTVRGEFVVIVS